MKRTSCWMLRRSLCRKPAVKFTRVGSIVFAHCEDHDPLGPLCKADEKDVKS